MKYLKSLNSYKLCGLMLMTGMLLAFISGVLAPGQGVVAAATPSADLETFMDDRLYAKVDHDEWTHVTAAGYVIGHILMLGGIVALWPNRLRRSPGDALARTGLLSITIAAAAAIAGALGDMTMTEVIKYGRTPGIADQDYHGYATVVNVLDVAFDFVILVTAFAGYLALATALAIRFGPGRRRNAHIGIAVASLAALALSFAGYHYLDAPLVQIGAGFLLLTTVWIVVLGAWIYKEDPQLLDEASGD